MNRTIPRLLPPNQETERPYMTGVTWIGNISFFDARTKQLMIICKKSSRSGSQNDVFGEIGRNRNAWYYDILVYPGILVSYPSWGIETPKCVNLDTSEGCN